MISRRDELATNLAAVEREIVQACADAGRDRSDVTLIAVTKTWPASDVELLAQLGVTDVGENRDQEAAAKYAACADLNLRWHFIGQIQTNKAASIATYSDVVHSIDRPKLVTALGAVAVAAGREIVGLIQVSLDPADALGRAGVEVDEVVELAKLVSLTPGLVLGGLMAVAPLGEDPTPAFARLIPTIAQLQTAYPEARIVSAGMSGDLSAAVKAGATHLRIGSSVLGSRAQVG